MYFISLPLKLILSGFNSEYKIVLCKFSQKISAKDDFSAWSFMVETMYITFQQ